MKESQIIAKRVAELEKELTQAKKSLGIVERDEASRSSVEERREYAKSLYRKILLDDSMDVESDAADMFISQVVSCEERTTIAAAYDDYIYGSLPIIELCEAKTLDAIINVLEACIDYIEDNYVLDIFLTYNPETNTITSEDEDEDEEEDEDEDEE
jgi:hypothetical protein